MGISYVKSLLEIWDPYQLRSVQIGGNKALYEFMREYGRERDEVDKKYKSDAANYYRRSLSFRVKNLPFEEKAPPRNTQELASRTSETVMVGAKQGWNTTVKATSEFDQKYQISTKTTAAAATTKAAIMGLFSKNLAGGM